MRLLAVLARADEGDLAVVSADVGAASIRRSRPIARRPICFEREIFEQWNVRPLGHPWLKPVRFRRCTRTAPGQLRRRRSAIGDRGVTDFFQMAGDEVHEVAVGPVHAGIIEPGHFRFQCHGETVYHLEISLGYQHRGVERAMLGGPDPRTIHYAETLAGDTHGRTCGRLLPRRRGPQRRPAFPPGASSSAAWPWSWSGSPTISAISARWPATSASCPPCPIADAFAATCST